MAVQKRERLKEIIAESYNKYADLYAKKKRLQTGNLNNLLAIVADYYGQARVLPSGSYLDVGCGTGNLFSILEQISGRIGGYSYVGIDISSEMIKVAKDTYPKGDFRVGDAEHLEFEDSSFDFVISNSVLHWL
ncbi:MAG: class I SAM-dependent methyltransferase, partial [Gammaproteobacteria bacterium]